MTQPTICFIGGGNMATSIIGGLLADSYPADRIIACDPVATAQENLATNFGIRTTDDNSSVAQAQVVILAVKPQVMAEVCASFKDHVSHRPLIISIAAGITTELLCRWIGTDLPTVRCMPNTPSLVQLGASGLYANSLCDADQRQIAGQIMEAVGIVEWLDSEAQLDAITALSGSGPAYFFAFMEAMVAAATKQGIAEAQASRLAIQTCLGAATLAQQSLDTLAELRQKVSSPGGTTLQALDSFQRDGLKQIVENALNAAQRRSVELAQEQAQADS